MFSLKIQNCFSRACLIASVTVLLACIHRHQSTFIGGTPFKEGKKLKVAIIRGRRVELCSYLLEGGLFVFCYSFENKSAGCRSVCPSHRWCSCPLGFGLLVITSTWSHWRSSNGLLLNIISIFINLYLKLKKTLLLFSRNIRNDLSLAPKWITYKFCFILYTCNKPENKFSFLIKIKF